MDCEVCYAEITEDDFKTAPYRSVCPECGQEYYPAKDWDFYRD